MRTLHSLSGVCESPTLHDQRSDANLGLSPADSAFRDEFDDESRRMTAADLDRAYEDYLKEQAAIDQGRKYPGFTKLPDTVLQSIVDSPFCPHPDDDPAIQRKEAAAELLRRKINPSAA